jgi:Putative metallopeptidase
VFDRGSRRVARGTVLPLLGIAIVLAFGSCGGDDKSGRDSGSQDRGKVTVVYRAIKPENQAAVDVVRKSRVFERIAAWTNEAIALPNNIEMKVSDSMPKAVLAPIAEPDGRTILIPASFLTQNYDVLKKFVAAVDRKGGPPSVLAGDKFNANALLAGAEQFIVAHEMGHALIHQLLLPLTGLEEDSADGFASFFSINDRLGPYPALAAAALFDELASSAGNPTVDDFASDHPITKQRVYNFLCVVLGGGDQKSRQELISDKLVPAVRAPVCPLEAAQLNYGWWTVLTPHLKKGYPHDLAARARETLEAQTKAFAAELKKLRGG